MTNGQGVGMETARTFVFYNEGHTLGNPMRTILMQQLDSAWRK